MEALATLPGELTFNGQAEHFQKHHIRDLIKINMKPGGAILPGFFIR
jgi:hypothetical protein